MSSPGVGLKNNQVPSQRQILEWGGGMGTDIILLKHVSMFQCFNEVWEGASWRRVRRTTPGAAGMVWAKTRGKGLCALWEPREATWLGLENYELEAEWIGPATSPVHKEPGLSMVSCLWGFYVNHLDCAGCRCCCVETSWGERSSLCAACFSLVVLNWV